MISHDPIILQWIEERGLRVPQDIGFVNPARAGGPDHCSAIDEHPEQIGATAVDILTEMIHRGERGIPAQSICHLIEGTWVQGSTVRRVRRPTPEGAPASSGGT